MKHFKATPDLSDLGFCAQLGDVNILDLELTGAEWHAVKPLYVIHVCYNYFMHSMWYVVNFTYYISLGM